MTQNFYPTFFRRARLMGELARALELPMVCIVAPIGYGKTMTAREVLPEGAVWQSLVSDSRAIFWEKVGAFLRHFHPEMAEKFLSMPLPESEKDIDKRLSCFESRAFEGPAYLVLDDCHVLHDPMCWLFLELLARRQVPHLHVVLLSRTRPPIALEDLCLKGIAEEIGGSDLSFTPEDIQGFFAQSGFTISLQNSTALHEATNGWVSAVCLYVRGYRGYLRYAEERQRKPSFADFLDNYENDQMYRLLEETVYRTSTDDEKKFLISLCPLGNFSIEAVDYIMDRVEGLTQPPRQILRGLLLGNSFVRKSSMGSDYQLHPILIFFLRKRLALQTRSLQDSVYSLIGDWYLHIDNPLAAFHYYIEGHQYEKLLTLFEDREELLGESGNKDLLIRCFSECPVTIKRRHLRACFLYAKALLLFGEVSLFKRSVFDIQNVVNGMEPGYAKSEVQGELELLLAYTFFGELEPMYEHLMKAALLMGGKTSRVMDKDFPFAFGANTLLTVLYREKGTLQETHDALAELLPVYRTLVPGGGDGALELFEAEAAYCQGEWNRSYDLIHQAMDRALESDQTSVLLMGYHILVQLTIIHGDYREYEILLKEIQRTVETSNRHELRRSAEMTLAGAMVLTKEDPKHIPEWIRFGHFNDQGMLPEIYLCAYMRYARVIMDKDDHEIFLSFYREMENLNRRKPSNILMIQAHLYRAISLWSLGKKEEAKDEARTALDLAKDDRIFIIFVQNYGLVERAEGLAPFMDEVNKDFMATVKKLYKEYITGLEALTPSLSLARLFTDRENQILSCLKRGYTNKQISAELFIAEITVKKNVARIAAKLGVKGRIAIIQALNENERR